MTVNFSDGHRARAGSVPPWGRRGKPRTSPTVAGKRQGWPQMPAKAKTINGRNLSADRTGGTRRRDPVGGCVRHSRADAGQAETIEPDRMPGRIHGGHLSRIRRTVGRAGSADGAGRAQGRERGRNVSAEDRRTAYRDASGVLTVLTPCLLYLQMNYIHTCKHTYILLYR